MIVIDRNDGILPGKNAGVGTRQGWRVLLPRLDQSGWLDPLVGVLGGRSR